MSLKDCVTSLLNSKSITKAVAEEIDNEVTRLLRQRNIDPQDVMRRAEVEVEIVGRYSQAAKVRLLGAARELKRLDEARTFMAEHKLGKTAGLNDYLSATDDAIQGILGNLSAPMAAWNTRMRAKGPGGFGGKNSAAGRALNDELLRGLHGEKVKDPLVIKTLKALEEIDKKKVGLKQQTGIDVTRLKNRIPRTWIKGKLARNAKTSDDFANFLLNEGVTTSGEGGVKNPTELTRAILKDMYEKIITGDNPGAHTLAWFKSNPNFKQQQSAALRELLPETESFSHLGRRALRDDLSGEAFEAGKELAKKGNKELGPKLGDRLRSSQVRERIVEIPNADAWKRIMKRFGNDDVTENIWEDLAKDAQTIAVANNFGPNPNRVFSRLEAEAKLADKGKKDLTKIGSSFFSPRKRYNVLTGQIDDPSIPFLSDVMGAARNLVGAALLSAASLSAISDQAFVRNVARNFGPDLGRVLNKQWKFYKDNFTSQKELEQAALRAGISIQHVLQSGGAANRFTETGITGSLSKITNRFMDFTLGSNGLNLMTRVAEWTVDLDIQGGMAKAIQIARSKEGGILNNLPDNIKALADEVGLKEKHLQKLSEVIEEDADVGYIFKPEKITDVDTLTKFSGFKHQLIREGVPRPGLTAKTIQSGGLKAGTIEGEVWRLLSQLQGFPISVFTNSMRIFAESSRYSDNLSRFTAFSRLAAEGLVLGALGIQLKQLGSGKSTYDWDNPDLWMSAAIMSSPLGILTDKAAAIPAEWNPFYDLTFKGSAFGPVGQFFDKVGRVGKELINAEFQDAFFEAVNVAEKATPGAFYMKLVFKEHVYNELKKIINQKRFNKQIKRARDRLAPEQQFFTGDN